MGRPAPGGKLFDGQHNMVQATIHLAEPLLEGQLGLYGELSLLELTGALYPPPGAAPVRLMPAPGRRAQFLGGRSLVGNVHSLVAVPDSGAQRSAARGGGLALPRPSLSPRLAAPSLTRNTHHPHRPPHPSPSPPPSPAPADWAPGEVRVFYAYHQLATGFLYQIKVSAPKLAKTGLPVVAATQAQDNTKGPMGATPAAGEVAIWLINLSEGVIRADGPGAPLTLMAGTLANA